MQSICAVSSAEPVQVIKADILFLSAQSYWLNSGWQLFFSFYSYHKGRFWHCMAVFPRLKRLLAPPVWNSASLLGAALLGAVHVSVRRSSDVAPTRSLAPKPCQEWKMAALRSKNDGITECQHQHQLACQKLIQLRTHTHTQFTSSRPLMGLSVRLENRKFHWGCIGRYLELPKRKVYMT